MRRPARRLARAWGHALAGLGVAWCTGLGATTASISLPATAADTPATAGLPAGLWIGHRPQPGSVALQGASVRRDDRADALETLAADDLAADLRRLGQRASSRRWTAPGRGGGGLQIWLGTLGRHAGIDALVAAGRLDAAALRDCWECFTLALVRTPAPGVPAALVIVGADRRGTAYGAYTLSRALGISPWHWWADVAPWRHGPLHLALAAAHTEGPAVRWRGLFINDEDWGLQPWSAHHFEPEAPGGRGMGPRTYQQVFRLMLRLRANTLWPAMHAVSGAFFAQAGNAEMARRHGIVIGSSHAEPLLRNNVSEWQAPAEQYNHASHGAQVRAYWAERLRQVQALAQPGDGTPPLETLLTLGMRGIHDSALQGASGLAAQQALLREVIAGQRALIAGHLGAGPAPQVFVPYKEVLPLYDTPPGLALPDDVTLVWPDDNFGYLRRLPQAAEAARPGGAGIYYHLSYLGAPLSYLWLSTTPPALVNHEMGRAFAAGAQRLWMVNAGDIKPAETSLSHWFDLAWNPHAVQALGQAGWLQQFAGQSFGPAIAPTLAALWDGYFRLNFERRPEHLQAHLPGERPRRLAWPAGRVARHLGEWRTLLQGLDAVAAQLTAAQQPGFFQLVAYPLRAAALANERAWALEAHAATRERTPAAATRAAWRAHRADARLKALTARYNRGRWAGMLAEEPADNLWPGYRLQPPSLPALQLMGAAAAGWRSQALQRMDRAQDDLPAEAAAPPMPDAAAPARADAADAAAAVALQAQPASGPWQALQGLQSSGPAWRALQAGAQLRLQRPPQPPGGTAPGEAGPACLQLRILPSYPALAAPQRPAAAEGWHADLLGPDGQRQPLHWPRGAQDAAWAQGVLANRLSARITVADAAAPLRIEALQADWVLMDAQLTPQACR
ncbi:glycosyl hydrolase 115 family protein [Aquabacterium sp. OR-4]|uniref:glycosyl hydrolase 115 family protein n=1 Tax=Aquabacterium sp. OR-4 TaxID=2978127 RepID=UPI0028C96B44|nr:glycosyl hydrolase 115 family protein [Aquabacterium sp. OR-4]MDT7838878.1 glycosyl hydrolase 115 family protein [Aquabacterium sp. OR-4]